MIQQLVSAAPETTHSPEFADAAKGDVIYQGQTLFSHVAVTRQKL